ncbi:MAG: hypothetical protein RQ751_03410, partial [Longimicrobiales bacterium]|nr:hypothetical protein [Longimicrobiales bacterium]
TLRGEAGVVHHFSDRLEGRIALGLAQTRSRDDFGNRDFTLLLLDGAREVERLALRGRSADDARAWLAAAVGRARAGGVPELEWPDYDLPAFPSGADGVMEPDGRALEVLEAWFADGALLLEAIRAAETSASEVRCWPHHFDIATLLTFPVGDEDTRYVGIGLSPGDESRAGPYWYVNGWPHPDPETLPEPPHPGEWNTEGWVGGVLGAAPILDVAEADAQGAAVAGFLQDAVARMKDVVLGGADAP